MWLPMPQFSLLPDSGASAFNKRKAGTDEIAWKLRALASFTEDLGSLPSTYVCGSSQPSVTPVSGDVRPSVASMGTKQACGTEIMHPGQHPYTILKQKSILKRMQISALQN